MPEDAKHYANDKYQEPSAAPFQSASFASAPSFAAPEGFENVECFNGFAEFTEYSDSQSDSVLREETETFSRELRSLRSIEDFNQFIRVKNNKFPGRIANLQNDSVTPFNLFLMNLYQHGHNKSPIAKLFLFAIKPLIGQIYGTDYKSIEYHTITPTFVSNEFLLFFMMVNREHYKAEKIKEDSRIYESLIIDRLRSPDNFYKFNDYVMPLSTIFDNTERLIALAKNLIVESQTPSFKDNFNFDVSQAFADIYKHCLKQHFDLLISKDKRVLVELLNALVKLSPAVCDDLVQTHGKLMIDELFGALAAATSTAVVVRKSTQSATNLTLFNVLDCLNADALLLFVTQCEKVFGLVSRTTNIKLPEFAKKLASKNFQFPSSEEGNGLWMRLITMAVAKLKELIPTMARMYSAFSDNLTPLHAMVKKINKALDDKQLGMNAKRNVICDIIASDHDKLNDEVAKKILMDYALIASPVAPVAQLQGRNGW